MRSNRLLCHLSLYGALLLPSIAALAGNTDTHSRFAGVYVSRPRDGAKSGPFMNLSLGRDGTATVTEDPGDGGTRTLFGHWNDTGSQVTVTFDAEEGKPAEPAMAFQPGHDGLQAVTWNRGTWGKENPPPMKKGGAKVKDLYWFTTNP
ncbi:MAG: hypothetical protein ABSC65_16235 [Acidobacteriaceae bacterium]|jgi:hypothetical protein